MPPSERQKILRQKLFDAGWHDSPESAEHDRIARGTDNGPAVLSPGQLRMWYHQQLAEGSTAYNFCLVLHPREPIVPEEFTAALADAAQRHAIFRTTYHGPGEDGEPYQLIRDDLVPSTASTDVADAADEEIPARIDELARRAQHTAFDLTRESSLRALFVRRGDSVLAVVLTLPHIAGDGGSFRTFLADLERCYPGADGPDDSGSDSAPRYLDYARRQRESLGSAADPGSRLRAQLDHWAEELAGLPTELPLPVDRPRPDNPTYAGAQHRLWLPERLSASVRQLAADHRVSLLSVLQAAVVTALHRAGAGTTIPLGTPVDLRSGAELAGVVGFFNNTVVLRTDVDDDPAFTDLLGRAQHSVLTAQENQDVPFEQVVERLNPPRSLARNPLFQIMIASTRAWPDLNLGQVRASAVEPEQTQAKFDLTWTVHELGDGGQLGISVLYALDLFDADTARQLLELAAGVLGQVAHTPGLRLSELACFEHRELTARGSGLAAAVARGQGARTVSRVVRLRPGIEHDEVAAALYRLLAAHDALRLRSLDRTGETSGIAGAADLLDRAVLLPGDEHEHDPDPARLRASLHGAGGPEPALRITAPSAWVDEESWATILAELAEIRDQPGTRPEPDVGSATSYRDYLDETAELATDVGMVEHADAWLELAERAAPAAGTTPRGEAPAHRSRAFEVAAPARIDQEALRTAVLASAHQAHHAVTGAAGHDWLVEMDEPDRDRARDHYRAVIGRIRRAFPVLLPAVQPNATAPGNSTSDAEVFLDAARRATEDGGPEHAVSYRLARELSPHTAGALDDFPAPDARITLSWTGSDDVRDAEDPPYRQEPDPSDRQEPADGPETAWSLRARVEQGRAGTRIVLDVEVRGEDRCEHLLDSWASSLGHCLEAQPIAAAEDRQENAELVPLTSADRRRLERDFGPLRDVLPLSPLQEGLLFHLLSAQHRRGPESGGGDVYNSQTTLTLHGTLDPERLRRAVRAAMDLCPTVGAGFTEHDERLLQVVPEGAEPPWRHLDLSGSGAGAADAARRFADEEYAAHFDPGRPPMVRFGLISLSQDEHRLLFTAHHILVDGWSIRLLLILVLRLYTNPDEVARPRPFRAYLDWVREQDATAAESAWRDVLTGAQPTLVAQHAQGTAATASRTAELGRTLPGELSERVEALAKETGTTVSTVFELAWATLLMRTTGSSDVAFGTVVSGRPPEIDGVDGMVGLLFNTVPARVRSRPGDSVRSGLDQLHRQKAVQLRYAFPSLSRLQQIAGQPALFDTLFAVQNLPRPDADERFGPRRDLHLHAAEVRDATHYPLSMAVTPEPGSVGLRLMYRTDVFDHEQADELFDRYVRVLDGITGRAEHPLHRVDALSEVDRNRILVEFDRTDAEITEQSVGDLLHRQAASTPGETAVVSAGTALSFADLDASANRLARLLRARSVRPEHRVALLLPRSELTVIGLFGVFAAHAAYVPIDGEWPRARIRSVMEQSAPTVILTTTELAGLLPEQYADDPRGVLLDDSAVRTELATFAPSPPEVDEPLGLDHLAYLIFTSGSTGEPKGVAVAYRGLTNMFHNHQAEIFEPVLAAEGGRRLRIAHTTSFSFDASWEQLLWLLAGHEVHVIDDELRRDPDRLLEHFDQHRIDAFDVTPTYGQYLVDHGLLDRPRPRGDSAHGDAAGVVFVSLGGEAVGEALWSRIREAPGVGGYNLYGPTEYTINALGADVAASTTPTVGKPIHNTRAYILDDGLLPAPAGVVGELYLAGVGLARGYVGNPGGTAERFVPNPFGAPGERMYRTGDLARRHADGSIDFLGRSDAQLKIRGYRVEPVEVENALLEHPAVGQAAVLGVPDESGAPRLAGYVVPSAAGTETIDVEKLREHAATALPSYMVPSVLVPVERLPLTVNGKLDADALPEAVPPGAARAAPARTAAEQSVIDAFAGLLQVETVGRDDDFFSLGGHSLLVVRLVGNLREVLSTDISVRDIYERPTPAALAAGAETAAADGAGSGSEHERTIAADAVLDDDITGDRLAPALPAGSAPDKILLTGATGFLGAFLLHELLERSSAEVFCVVRADDETQAAGRLRETLLTYQLWQERWADRITAVPGDLAQPRLGLTAHWHERLAAEIQVIYHNGAKVNDIEPYEKMRATNVGGAREVLRLACTGTVKPVHFTSTGSVLVRPQDNAPVLPEDMRLEAGEVSANGYVSSKWVAEELMHAAAGRDIPTTVYRPGRISGHSRTGVCPTGIGFWYFIRAMVLLEAAPVLRSDEINLAPVDYVSGAVVRIAEQPGSSGTAYHLVNESPVRIADILGCLVSMGYPLAELPFDEWKRLLDTTAEQHAGESDDRLSPAVLLSEHYAKYLGDVVESQLGQEHTFAQLAESGFRCPAVTAETLTSYVRHFIASGFFPAPKQRVDA